MASTRLLAYTDSESVSTAHEYFNGGSRFSGLWSEVVSGVDWRGLLRVDAGYRLGDAAIVIAIETAEAVLQTSFPPDLRAMYRVCDGIFDTRGQWDVIWPIAELLSRNQDAYVIEGAKREELVGFGDDGTGDPFCVRRDGGSEVVFWSPIDQEGTHLADDVESFWRSWIAGTLPVH